MRVLPVCITRFASQRARPLESLTALPIKERVTGPPNPWMKSCASDSRDPNWAHS